MSAPRRPGVGERRFAAASDGAEERAPTPTCAFYLFIRQPHGSEVSPAARNTLDSARIPRASKLLICGLFQKGRVLAQDAILGWHRRLVAKKFDSSKNRQYPGRPRVLADIEELVVRLAKENKSWGYDRIARALANLGHEVADQTVGNILKRHGIPLAPERRKTTTWREFIRSHMDVLTATDFFTAEVWTQGGLVTYYVVFFMHLATRRVHVAGITPHPNEQWMTQVARNVTMADVGFLSSSRYLIHDRDSKFCESFHRTIEAVGVAPVKLPARSPDLNSFAERWVKSVEEECLSKLILFGEKSLRHALREYVVYYHHERNHQGKENLLLFPASDPLPQSERKVRSRERLGGLLRFYHREAA